MTTRAFLGLTVACAQCHNHKFDPIPTKDYYALFGVFESATDDESHIKRAYRLLYSREPSGEELWLGKEFLREGSWPDYAQVLLSANEFRYVY